MSERLVSAMQSNITRDPEVTAFMEFCGSLMSRMSPQLQSDLRNEMYSLMRRYEEHALATNQLQPRQALGPFNRGTYLKVCNEYLDLWTAMFQCQFFTLLQYVM